MPRGPAWMRGSAIAVLVTALGGCREATTPEFSRLVSGMCAQPAPLLGTADPAAPGFIVRYHDSVNAVSETDRLANKYGLTPSHVYTSALQGFSAVLAPETVASLRCEGSILIIEHDAVVIAN